ncbi:N-acetylmuramoyl-L-alanine amidase [Cryobacterium sp. PH31-O1]|uniref:N-acetylmuramoyl-L-alanine amidase n=1 Tax=Cryobacterium sp. PH31-O1 TaxID=3046306 RepID=UPI0024BB1339|nr:N-acetylmuramoyl-L-alanine amidase [Cryobacterium sp. PH31-O1]MDJ0338275.1 N-acetylmuramoyl-L-alanine amidase [Cryobacterium sp. PH31-O1]
MAFSGLVTRHSATPNHSTRNAGTTPKYIVHHHMATTGFSAVLASWASGRKQGSCHVAISNSGELVGVVDESRRAWSLSSSMFDSQALVTEIANSAVGGGWLVSAAATEAAAQLTADWCRRFSIPCDRDHVIGHREVYTRFKKGYATACPGGLDLDGIVNRARQILGQGGSPLPASAAPAAVAAAPVSSGGGWAFNLPDAASQLRVQRALAGRNPSRYTGPQDGALGPNGFRGIQITIRGVGYSGPVDGVIGAVGCRLIQVYAAKFGDYRGPVDSILGPNSWAGFALGLERP